MNKSYIDTVRLLLRVAPDIFAQKLFAMKGFLLRLLRTEPDWSLLQCSHASELPRLKWKLENLVKFRKQQPDAFQAQTLSLERLLGS